MNNGNKSVLLLSNRVRDGKMLQSGWMKTPQRVPPNAVRMHTRTCICTDSSTMATMEECFVNTVCNGVCDGGDRFPCGELKKRAYHAT